MTVLSVLLHLVEAIGVFVGVIAFFWILGRRTLRDRDRF